MLIIFDGHSTNVNFVKKKSCESINPTTDGKPTPTAQSKLKTSFKHNGDDFFPTFCLPPIIKTCRKAFFNKDFHYPTLALSSGFVLEAGVCSVKWMRDLHHKNKEKRTCNYRMPKIFAYADNLNKQKVPLPQNSFESN